MTYSVTAKVSPNKIDLKYSDLEINSKGNYGAAQREIEAFMLGSNDASGN